MSTNYNMVLDIEESFNVGIGDNLIEAMNNMNYKVYTLNNVKDFNKFIELLNKDTKLEIRCTCNNGYERHMISITYKPLNVVLDILRIHWDIVKAEYNELNNKCKVWVKSNRTVPEDIEYEKYIVSTL